MTDSGSPSIAELKREIEDLRRKLAEAEEVIHAISTGEVDAVVVSRPEGEKIFTLKGAEYSYRVLVEAMNEGAATLSAQGIVLYCNRTLANLVALPQETIIGSPVAELFAPHLASTFQAVFSRALGGRASRVEIELQNRSGRSVPAYVSLSDIKGEEPAAICMVVTDLTDQKKRDELIAAGALARSVLESAAEAIAVCDDRGQIIIANHAMQDLCGCNPASQPFEIALPLEFTNSSGPGEPFSLHHAARNNRLEYREVLFRRADGQQFWLLPALGLINGPGGVSGSVVSLTDITSLKQAQEALRASEERWATTLQSIGDAVISTCAQGKIQFMNNVAQKLTGWQLEDAEGKELSAVFNIVQEVTRIKPENPVAKVIREGGVVGLANHTMLIRRNGTEIPIEDSGAPIRDREGRIQGVVLVFHDVSEARKIEKALRNSERLATTGRLAASIAHEIHNPLDTVGSLLYLVEQDTKEEKTRQQVSLAAQELQRISQMTQQMLTFQRESAKPIPVKIEDILDNVLALYDRKLASTAINVSKEIEFQHSILAQPGEMRQVFANLVSNAIEACDRNHGEIRLRAYASRDWRNGRGGLRVVVADNGKGIPADVRENVFEPFFTTKGESGTGLGLWISAGIVAKYEGTMRLRSSTQAGRSGTYFSVFFPTEAHPTTGDVKTSTASLKQ